MFLQRGVTDIEAAAFHVRQLMQMSSLNPAVNIGTAVAALLGTTITSNFIPGTPECPSFWYGGNRSWVIVYIRGTETIAQATSLVDGYGPSILGPVNHPDNAYLNAAANIVLNTVVSGHFLEPENMMIVGHSLGGAIAAKLLSRFRDTIPTIKTRCVSFGAPRAGDDIFVRRVDGRPLARFFNSDDPVPLVPPRVVDTPLLALAASPRTIINYSHYVHTKGGIELANSGGIVERILPSGAASNPTTSLASWILGLNTSGDGPHSLSRYLVNLNANLPLPPITRPVEPKAAGPERVGDAGRTEITAAERAVSKRLHRQQEAQNAPPIHIPQPRLFVAFRSGRTWQVAFGDQIVATLGSKKAARGLAREGNVFLRRMQRSAIASPQALVDQFQAYLAAASDPLGGFVPVLATDLAP